MRICVATTPDAKTHVVASIAKREHVGRANTRRVRSTNIPKQLLRFHLNEKQEDSIRQEMRLTGLLIPFRINIKAVPGRSW